MKPTYEELEARVAELEARCITEYERGMNDGWDTLHMVIGLYFEPLTVGCLPDIEHLLGMVEGYIAKHKSNLSKPFFDNMVLTLGDLLNRADKLNKEMALVLQTALYLDLSVIHQYRDAMILITSRQDPHGQTLRKLARTNPRVSRNFDLIQLTALRGRNQETLIQYELMTRAKTAGLTVEQAAERVAAQLGLTMDNEPGIIANYYRVRNEHLHSVSANDNRLSKL